jgi:hypothetical protein
MKGKKVRIKTEVFEGDVLILDKRLTNMAMFSNTAVMNNASFEVYVGIFCDLEEMEVDCPIIEFLPKDIIELY